VYPMGAEPPRSVSASSITPPAWPTTRRLPGSTTALEALEVLVVVSTGTCMRYLASSVLAPALAAAAMSVSRRNTPDTRTAWHEPPELAPAGTSTTESQPTLAATSSIVAETGSVPVPAIMKRRQASPPETMTLGLRTVADSSSPSAFDDTIRPIAA
jgi:hypothetical protein